MIAKDLINYMIPPLKIKDDVEKAKLWMEELRVSELPVTDQGKFQGMLSEELIFDADKLKMKVGNYDLIAKDAIVSYDTHYYNVLKTSYAIGTRLVAVKDENGQYMGVVSTENVVEAFANSSFINIPGAILILSMDFRDYSLAEISRIIELDEGKILSSHILTDNDDPSKIRLTLKINKEEITHLASSLEARGYRIAETYNKSQIDEDNMERYGALMKYLKI